MSKDKKRYIMAGLVAAVILFIVLIVTVNFKFIGKKSIHEDAKKYQTRHCLVFYPDSDKGKQVAESLCETGEKDSVYDYAVIRYGDYYLIEYGNNVHYYTDQYYVPIKINDISMDGRLIVSDYLRYNMKKQGRDEYYSSKFLEDSYYDYIDLTSVKYEIDGTDLLCTFDKYNITIAIPLKYMQEPLGMNFGYKNEMYIKPKYIDPERPIIALTFDDGPYSPVGQQIVDVFYRYDSNCTFFVVGNRLSANQLEFMKDSISKGNEYGSHTSDHSNLLNLDGYSGARAVLEVSEYTYEKIGYKMNIYRSPYGNHNSSVSSNANMKDILWNVDSLDWKSRNAESVKDIIFSSVSNHDVLLFHELYQSTADAIKDIVPELIDRGYQLVTVTELMNVLNVDLNDTNTFSGR